MTRPVTASRVGRRLARVALFALFTWAVAAPPAWAQPPAKSKPVQSTTRFSFSGKSIHISCNRSLHDLNKNTRECFGNVYIRRTSELLTADYALLDMNTASLRAEGNVVYFTPDAVIYGARMDFNFETETGVIEDGRVESDKYELLGERIERLSSEHFRAEDGEYTTCRDCPASWRLGGRKIDLTVNGYAHLKHVMVRINETPTIYLPYIVVPVKTSRQSGLLFPRQGASEQDGFQFVQPYFWAISRSMDATLGAGFYSKHGVKGEGEFRYLLSERTRGQLSTFYLRDRVFPFPDRWAINYNHNLELPWKIEQKLQYLDASDRKYPQNYPGDIPGYREPGLISTAGLSRAGRDVSVWVSANRIRNLLTTGLVGVDPNTVQVLPAVSIATQDQRVSEDVPLHWGLGGTYTRFWRRGPSFDPVVLPPRFQATPADQFTPGETPLRRADRFMLIPELYYTTRLWDVLEILPSVQYRSFFYSFDRPVAPPLSRGYLLTQAEVATTVERVYAGSVKHKFRPSLVYSNIPVIEQDPHHPFVEQLRLTGNQLDDADIVPISNESQVYFVPLGNSLSYRLGNKFILKSDDPANRYKKVVDVTAGQSIDFIQYRNAPTDRRPLSRFFTLASVEFVRVSGNGEFYYYPYSQASTYSLGANYVFAKYMRRLLSFERSVGVRYNYDQVTSHAHEIGGALVWSINDYFRTHWGITYQFPMTIETAERPGVVREVSVGVTYQSPSQCYNIVSRLSQSQERGVNLEFLLPVNLSGEGFVNLTGGGGGAPAAGLVPGQQ